MLINNNSMLNDQTGTNQHSVDVSGTQLILVI